MIKTFKKNWMIFNFISLISLFIVIFSVVNLHHQEVKKLQTKQLYTSKLFESYTISKLSQLQSILKLISTDRHIYIDLHNTLIDNIISNNPLIIGFAFSDANGKIKSLSSNLNNQFSINPLNNTSTKNDFIKSTQTNDVIICKPYYHNKLKTWIVPLRKRIIDQNGKTIGVFSIAFDLYKLSEKLNKEVDKKFKQEIIFDDSFLTLFSSHISINKYPVIYNDSFVRDLSSIFKSHTLSTLHESSGFIRKGNAILTYNKKFDLWFYSTSSTKQLTINLIKTSCIYSCIYLFFIAILFIVFKWNDRLKMKAISAALYQSQHDILTGLYNRNILTSKYIHKKYNRFLMVYININNFQIVNDLYGYEFGDLILIKISKRLNKFVTNINGIAIRATSDKFILLVENQNEIKDFCQRLSIELCRTYCVKKTSNVSHIDLSVSIGIVPCDSKQKVDINTLISYASHCMLISKNTNNQFTLFSDEINNNIINNIKMESELKRAVVNNEISMMYQPQVNKVGELYGVEALVRWKNPTLGFISPNLFIPAAEKIGIMPKLGEFIIEQSLKEISAFQQEHDISFKLSINISVCQFVQDNFINILRSKLNKFKSSYLEVTIEITENLFIERMDKLLPIFNDIKQENILLSLDDFGTGYSSLSLLKEIPIDELKIDKSFIDNVIDNEKDNIMVKNIIKIGKDLGITVLAEGIENYQQLDFLHQNGCDIYQGYYYSKPLNLADLSLFINR
ncbi:bifunctional diguanylate cyclase/phosphodiesterase [Vibrio rarus]|uniref:bifunctional diguanylate cyclase/phosphodiesterase n=1 Tax=Vibrio rarus TaxID=413403 RepID=UPI0021C31831|nr:EAL domain-containing protein [Vibrio rarus]